MKPYWRILTLLLTLVLALSMFVGCNSEEEESETFEEETDDGSAVDYFPDIDKKNYNSKVYMYVLGDSNPNEYYIIEEDKNDGSPMAEAIYNRQLKIQRYLGAEIVKASVPSGTNHTNYTELLKTAVKNKDGSLDILVTHVNSGVSALISEGYLYDLTELNSIDLDAEYWNQEFMQSLELNGHQYLGFSDYNILYTYVVAFNKKMMAQYEGSLDKSAYQLVKDYEWTWDELIALANLVYIDNGDGKKSVEDTYGITGCQWVSFCGILQASDVNMVEMDESGNYKVVANSDRNFERTEILVNKIKNLAKSNSSYFDYQKTGNPNVPLTSERTLMQFAATISLDDFLDYNLEFGVLPYPMYDVEQGKDAGYRGLQWGGYITVPSYTKNITMVGETLELLAYYAEPVKITYYEKLLGKQVADMPDDAAMLNIVWNSVCTDFGQTFNGVGGSSGICYLIPTLTHVNANQGLSSYFASTVSSVNNGITKFLKGLK